MSSLGFLAVHAGAFLALAATAYIAGRFALRRLFREDEPQIAGRFAVASTFGLVALATIGALLGWVGQLARTPLLVAVLGIHALGWAIWRDVLATTRIAPRRRWIFTAAVVAAIPLVAFALYPPTAFDETLYHLPFARAFAETGRLPFLPELRFPVFPQLGEVLATEVLLFAGDTATHFVSLFAVALTAALLGTWAGGWQQGQENNQSHESNESRESQGAAGWLAAAIWLGNPLVVYLSGTGYVEPLLALFVTAGCYAFWKWRRSGTSAWLGLSAIFVGAAAGTKYLGLFFVGALALATLWPDRSSPHGRRQTLRNLVLFGVVSAIAMAPWYGRIVAFTGNPVFPYLSGIFGANEWTPVRFRTLSVPSQATDWVAAFATGARKLVTLPWDVFARRHLTGGLPPISPAYLVGIPLLVFVALRHRTPLGRTLRGWLLLAASFVCLFPVLPADARHLVAVLPLFSLVLGVALTELVQDRRSGTWGTGWPRSGRLSSHKRVALVGFALALALPGWLYAWYRISLQGPPPTEPVAREAYLRRALPLYPAVARVNELRSPGDVVYGLHVESMHYYSRGDFFGDFYGPHRFGLLPYRKFDPVGFLAKLESWSVDYLVVSRAATDAARAADALAGRGLTLVFEDRAAVVYAVRPPTEGR